MEFELTPPTPRRKRRTPESGALAEVLRVVKNHPRVSWAHRMNSGCCQISGRFVRFGFPGCPDVLGMLRDGTALAIEVKSPCGQLREEQSIFLELVTLHGGCAIVARCANDVFRGIAAFYEEQHHE